MNKKCLYYNGLFPSGEKLRGTFCRTISSPSLPIFTYPHMGNKFFPGLFAVFPMQLIDYRHQYSNSNEIYFFTNN